MPRGQQVWLRACQCVDLLASHVQRQSGIELGIVHAATPELPVLVVFHQVVVGVAREGQRAQPERV